jgi:hypothetical protein
MKFLIGEVYMQKVPKETNILPNKTRMFMLPIFREYGVVFTNKLNNVFKVAVGIGDVIYDNHSEKRAERHLFILLDSRVAFIHFVEFLDWIREQDMYEDDYVYDNIQITPYHMVVLRIPPKFYDSFETFKKGKYSEMFDQGTIDQFFQRHPEVQKILIKDHNYKVKFVEKLNATFNTEVDPDEWKGECELPPNPTEEVFNT